jgi:hypothetical protein
MFGLIGFVVVIALAVYGAVEFYKTFRKRNVKKDWAEDFDQDIDWDSVPPPDEYYGEIDESDYPHVQWHQETVEPPPVKKPRKPRTTKKPTAKKTRTKKESN